MLLLGTGRTFAFHRLFSGHVLVLHALPAAGLLLGLRIVRPRLRLFAMSLMSWLAALHFLPLRIVHRVRAGHVFLARLAALRLGRGAVFVVMAFAALLLERTDLALGFVLGDAIAFLDRASQLVTLAFDAVQVIVRELAALLLHFALELLPVALHSVPVHCSSPRSVPAV